MTHPSVRRRSTSLRATLVGALCLVAGAALGACGADTDGGQTAEVSLQASTTHTVEVDATLRVPIALDAPTAADVTWAIDTPDLPSIAAVARLSGTPQGAEFTYTPLVSHVGTHAFVVRVDVDGATDEIELVVTVSPSSSTAPSFAAPGAGGTYRLADDPCVRFDIEAADDDSTAVALTLASGPAGATVLDTGPKSGEFEWCPTPAQIDEKLRWNATLRADDGNNPPVDHDYVIVLRVAQDSECEGRPPSVAIVSPAKGSVVASDGATTVTVRATDPDGTVAPPTLYWSTEAPADPDAPDLSLFTPLPTAAGDAPHEFSADVPSLGLTEGQEAIVWLVATAVDDDDPFGDACDHTSTSPVIRYIARPGSDPIDEPVEPTPDPSCIDDLYEDDDTLDDSRVIEAGELVEGTICPADDDWLLFAVDEPAVIVLELLLDYELYDLDLELYDENGELLEYSESLGDERIEWLVETPGLFAARVYGYSGAAGDWFLFLEVDPL